MLKKKNNKGFTLVELLVVIAIIGILAVVAVPALFKNIEKGKVSDLEADISAIRSASLSYYADNSTYPEGDIFDKDGNVTNTDIKDEIEGLSNPFKATNYTLEESSPGGALQLKITQKSGSEMSENALSKLKKDLGDMVVGKDENSTTITINLINK
ncbi:type IV pilin protein [Romboutsia lituseburensis]|uniref:General secretion pathway protein G n=1 Tax=Romboutsia lituseburensis DSM 797 TaxID=1121325 RepID=A0A1G9TNP8_9FIRM|nr:type II secretion system protein [Romboutsia lituseburensis]CEH32644.1 Type IV pilin N-term methylation site GFxxxE [Romboutsia lituseburensis]SDM49449.1 general secretion pathway protein G [Romboutsia lituseburensis DSM 797]